MITYFRGKPCQLDVCDYSSIKFILICTILFIRPACILRKIKHKFDQQYMRNTPQKSFNSKFKSFQWCNVVAYAHILLIKLMLQFFLKILAELKNPYGGSTTINGVHE